MAITASDVNKLRQQTGAGMMDCKNALVEADGDFEAAVDILRKKGQKIAAKRGDNDAKEGVIMAQTSADGKSGVILTLNCETDFVAKTEGYVAMVQSLVDIALEKREVTSNPKDITVKSNEIIKPAIFIHLVVVVVVVVESCVNTWNYFLTHKLHGIFTSIEWRFPVVRKDVTWSCVT